MKIIAFACQWCAYRSADLAGTLKYEYPSSITIIKVPCSGRVETEFILKALAEGADGVFVAGCPKNECHYRKGNFVAELKTSILSNILPEFGLESSRIAFLEVSSSDAKKFVEFARNFDERVRSLGRNPIRRDSHEKD